MVYFFACVTLLILGYLIYGRLIDRLFGADPSRPRAAAAQVAISIGVVHGAPRRIAAN